MKFFFVKRTCRLVENFFILHFEWENLRNNVNSLLNLLLLFIILHEHLYLLAELISVVNDIRPKLPVLNLLIAILQILVLFIHVIFKQLFTPLSLVFLAVYGQHLVQLLDLLLVNRVHVV